ncbi:MAG: hypothetical protein GF398_14035 [Chitinivibrionales bacterium]|nr:hypothetical protein [Chitinivibrionales bacterium]
MAIPFTIDEIFKVAITIEVNGEAFYRKIAALQSEPDKKSFLLSLAHQEQRHQEIFNIMRNEVAANEHLTESFDPQGEAALYLDALIEAYEDEGDLHSAEALEDNVALKVALHKAIEQEMHSILYYHGLRDTVPETISKDKIDRIIDEEKMHVVQIAGILKNHPEM